MAHQESQNDKGAAGDNGRDVSQSPPTLDELNRAITKNCERDAQDENRHRRASTYLSAAVAFFAGVQAVVSYWQWTVMDESLRLTRDSISDARQSHEVDRRPWVLIDKQPPVQFKVDVELPIGIAFKNFGETPALRVRPQCTVRVRKNLEPLNPTHGESTTIDSSFVLGPGQPSNVMAKYTPTIEDIAALYTNARYLNVFCTIEYGSVFDSSRVYGTHYCAQWDAGTGRFLACGETYNSAE